MITLCAHCGDGPSNPRDSGDHGRAVKCPACGCLVCPSCRAMSGPSVCGSFADDDENAYEVAEMETAKHERARVAAWRRSTLREEGGIDADATYPLRPEIIRQLGTRRSPRRRSKRLR